MEWTVGTIVSSVIILGLVFLIGRMAKKMKGYVKEIEGLTTVIFEKDNQALSSFSSTSGLQKTLREMEKVCEAQLSEIEFQKRRHVFMDAMMRSLGRYTASTATLWVMRPYIVAKACITQRHDATIKMVDSNYIPLISGLDVSKYAVSEYCTSPEHTNIFQGTAQLPKKWDNFFGHITEYKSFYNAEMYIPVDMSEQEREIFTMLMLEPDVNEVFFSLMKTTKCSITGNMVYIGSEKEHIRWFGHCNLNSKVPDLWHAFLTAIGSNARSETHRVLNWSKPDGYTIRTSNDHTKSGPVFAEFMMVTSTNKSETEMRESKYRTLVH